MRVLTLDFCAGDADISRRTLERSIERGDGPPTVQLSLRRKGILESDWNAWLMRRRARGTPGPCARCADMQALLIRLYREAAASEGQVAKATGLDRVEIRRLADEAGGMIE